MAKNKSKEKNQNPQGSTPGNTTQPSGTGDKKPQDQSKKSEKNDSRRNMIMAGVGLLVIIAIIVAALIVGLSNGDDDGDEDNEDQATEQSNDNDENNEDSEDGIIGDIGDVLDGDEESDESEENNGDEEQSSTSENSDENSTETQDDDNDGGDGDAEESESSDSTQGETSSTSTSSAASTAAADSGMTGHSSAGLQRSVDNQARIQTTNVWFATDYQPGDIVSSPYTVQYGDTLWEIADGYYGNAFNWLSILNANSASVGFLPDGSQALILPGQVLTLP